MCNQCGCNEGFREVRFIKSSQVIYACNTCVCAYSKKQLETEQQDYKKEKT